MSDSAFNSIKVRLKHEQGVGRSESSIFQFHKGAIETRAETACARCRSTFNSIKVRLKLGLQFKQSCFAVFQFHKGAIETWGFSTAPNP